MSSNNFVGIQADLFNIIYCYVETMAMTWPAKPKYFYICFQKKFTGAILLFKVHILQELLTKKLILCLLTPVPNFKGNNYNSFKFYF
jgi:hypothetical protein